MTNFRPERSVETRDVVVVGGRCAGSATARLLATRGHDVLVVDRAALPSDTLSTHGLMRGGVVQLARWGLLDRVLATGAPPVRQVTFVRDGDEVTRPVKDSCGVSMLLAPRRYLLDAVLADAACQAGATYAPCTRLAGLLRDPSGRVLGVRLRDHAGAVREVRARYVVGADGLRSTTAALVDAPVTRSFEADVAAYYGYVEGLDDRGFEFHIGDGSYAGVFPTHHDQACVWLIRPTPLLAPVRVAGADRRAALLGALERTAPSLGERVRRGRWVSPVRGAARLPNLVRRAAGPGWALVGDAGYHRDPITGHGITDAFRDAELLAAALDRALRQPVREQAAFTDYERARDRALDETFRITEQLCRFPDPARFLELQVELSGALDREAQMLASLPAPAGLDTVETTTSERTPA